MRPLTRKLMRDVLKSRGPALAIAAVIGAGIALFVIFLSCLHSLHLTQQAYYERYRFADVFASLERAPERLADQVAAIDGVARVRTRVVRDVTLDIPGSEEPATGRMISHPTGSRPVLCDVFLRRGRMLEQGVDDEILLSEDFAEANGLGPGDSLHAVINGSRRRLRIVGIALSPEYIYSIRPGEMIPDDRRFAVIWIARKQLASAFSMEGGFNDVVLRLAPGADEGEIIRRLDDLLDPYGGRGAYPRSLQMSHWYLTSEMEGLRKFGSTIPLVFLAVAAFLLNVVMTRLVTVQREQIASLKALGYSNAAVGWHYVQWALAVAAIGVALGVAAGAWFGAELTDMYTAFFDFPILTYSLPPRTVLDAAAAGVVAAVLGGLIAVRRAVRLPPAEAMRPEPPTKYRRSIVERLGLGALLPETLRITLRSIERRPARTLISVVGIAAGAALLVSGSFSLDAMEEMLELQFEVAQRYDVAVSFFIPASAGAIDDLRRLPGVTRAEGYRAIAVRYRHGHRSRTGQLTGINGSDSLNRVIDADGRVLDPPPRGVVLSTKLAQVLGASVGEELEIEVLEGRRPRWRLPISGTMDELLGTNAYLARSELHRLLEESAVLSGAWLSVDEAQLDRLYYRLKRTPLVAGVLLQRAALESFEETMGEMVGTIRAVNVLFAVIIAFGVVYNAARISLAERARELATLRVLGFRRSEIAQILLAELAIVTALAIPLGLWLGRLMARLVVAAYDTELFRMPLLILPRTYALAALTLIAASLLSGSVVRRKLLHLDLIGVLKTRE